MANRGSPFGGGGFGGSGGGNSGFGGGNSPGGGQSSGPRIGGNTQSPGGQINTQVVPGAQVGPGSGTGGVERRSVTPGGGTQNAAPLVNPQAGQSPQHVVEGADPAKPIIHIFVFARYQNTEGEKIVKDLGYLHAASGSDFHLILAGYSDTRPAPSSSSLVEPKEIPLSGNRFWYYDDTEFRNMVDLVQDSTTWKYRGGFQLLICDVNVRDGEVAGIRQSFEGGQADLEKVIVVDVDEMRACKLFADFDRFFNALRDIIAEVRAKFTSQLTWKVSDRLALTQDGVALKVIAKSFKLDFLEAYETAQGLSNFAVRNLRKR